MATYSVTGRNRKRQALSFLINVQQEHPLCNAKPLKNLLWTVAQECLACSLLVGCSCAGHFARVLSEGVFGTGGDEGSRDAPGDRQAQRSEHSTQVFFPSDM